MPDSAILGDLFPIVLVLILVVIPLAIYRWKYRPAVREAVSEARFADLIVAMKATRLDAARLTAERGGNWPYLLRDVEQAAEAHRTALHEAIVQQKESDRLVGEMRIFFFLSVLAFVPILLFPLYYKAMVTDRSPLAVSVPALETLARTGTKDLETLITLLTQSPPLVNGPLAGGPVSMPVPVTGGIVDIAWWVGLVLLAIPVGIFLWAWGGRARPYGMSLVGASTALISLAPLIQHAPFLKDLTFVKDFSLFNIKDAKIELLPNLFGGGRRSPDSIIVLNIQPGTDKPLDPVWASNMEFVCQAEEKDNPKSKVSMKVKTFVPGKTDELMNDKNAKAVDVLRDQIHALARDRELAGLLLIGSADKQPMNPETEAVQYSNLSLAQGRAAWVGSRLKDNKGYPEISTLSTIVVLGAPPSHVGKAVPAKDLDDDRSVIACVLLRSKPEK